MHNLVAIFYTTSILGIMTKKTSIHLFSRAGELLTWQREIILDEAIMAFKRSSLDLEYFYWGWSRCLRVRFTSGDQDRHSMFFFRIFKKRYSWVKHIYMARTSVREKYFVKMFQYGLNYTVKKCSVVNRLCDQLVCFFTSMFIIAWREVRTGKGFFCGNDVCVLNRRMKKVKLPRLFMFWFVSQKKMVEVCVFTQQVM